MSQTTLRMTCGQNDVQRATIAVTVYFGMDAFQVTVPSFWNHNQAQFWIQLFDLQSGFSGFDVSSLSRASLSLNNQEQFNNVWATEIAVVGIQ